MKEKHKVKNHQKEEKEKERPQGAKDTTTELKETFAMAKQMGARDILAFKRMALGYTIYGAVNAIEQLADPKERLKEYKDLYKMIAEVEQASFSLEPKSQEPKKA